MTKGETHSEEAHSGVTGRLLMAGNKVFNRYILLRVLGRGGMGVVWLARDEELNRHVAIKFLPEQVWRDPEAVSDLKRETKRSLELTHPHIVRIFDFITDAHWSGISMEFVEGGTLAEKKGLRSQRCFDAGEIGVWIKQICEALDYAHQSAKIVHRDLKPSNIMLTSRGGIKVADFGIARNISETMSRISAGNSSISGGTLAYMSPQQLNGEKPAPLDDIYALGATIYEMLTGKPPFYSGDLYSQVLNKTAPSMTERRKELEVVDCEEIPEAWEDVVAACLSKDKAKRPQSAGRVAELLGLAERESPVRAVPQAERQSTFQNAVIGAGVAAILAVGGLVWAKSKPKVEPAAINPQAAPVTITEASASASNVFENSLGMRFVPVGDLLFSIWETRVKDFEAFVNETGHNAKENVLSENEAGIYGFWGADWADPGFPQTPNHPALGVSRDDAQAFCRWLTHKEHVEGKLEKGKIYRLPTDLEWSHAAGLEGETGSTPAERDGQQPDVYPWGKVFPPPSNAGNYKAANDGYEFTAPVGSFSPNKHGLYDMGGNLYEWCEDWYDDRKDAGVLRGASFLLKHPHQLCASRRFQAAYAQPYKRNWQFGFRVVLAPESSPDSGSSKASGQPPQNSSQAALSSSIKP